MTIIITITMMAVFLSNILGYSVENIVIFGGFETVFMAFAIEVPVCCSNNRKEREEQPELLGNTLEWCNIPKRAE